MCAPTGVAGSSTVAGATTVAGEHIPGLRTITPVLTGVRNTPGTTHAQAALVAVTKQWDNPTIEQIPVCDGTHVQADVFKSPNQALLHGPEVS